MEDKFIIVTVSPNEDKSGTNYSTQNLFLYDRNSLAFLYNIELSIIQEIKAILLPTNVSDFACKLAVFPQILKESAKMRARQNFLNYSSKPREG